MITNDLFFSLDNPVIFSVFISITIAWIIYFFYVKIYIPLHNKHQLEKENIELKNSRLMAMFAELDPEPLFRFNVKGEIILTNESGSNILKELGSSITTVADLLPLPEEFNFEEFISKGNIYLSTVLLGDSYYDVTVKGLPDTGFGQIYCNDITDRKRAEEALNISRIKLRELSSHIQKLQEEEKKKISRELHDNFGQMLTSIKMNLEILKGKNINKPSDDLFSDISLQLDEAKKEIREISYRLRPRVLDDLGLVPALKMLAEDVSEKTGIKGIFQSHNYNCRLDSDIETNLYRIVQEALNNIAKHSRASEFFIQLVKHEDKIILSVDDDGLGYNNTQKEKNDIKSGMGMINMAERAISLNGKFNITSEPGKGSEILIEIPLDQRNG
jgi:signal transduction histidine kinase